METETYTLPEFWASPLINGDISGLDAQELIHLGRWLNNNPQLGGCLTCSDNSKFRSIHDAVGVLATNCLDFVFPVEISVACKPNMTY